MGDAQQVGAAGEGRVGLAGPPCGPGAPVRTQELDETTEGLDPLPLVPCGDARAQASARLARSSPSGGLLCQDASDAEKSSSGLSHRLCPLLGRGPR